jgi:glycosyltransferase involved in cell wall biosynthesis
MIIGIDGNEANVKELVGVSTYTQNLLFHFKKRANNKLRFKIYLRNNPLDTLPKQNAFLKYTKISGKFLWSQLFLPINLLINNKNDVFFSPAHYSPRFSLCPTVVTIHDLSYYYFADDFLKKDLFKLKRWTKYSVLNAKKIIAVSNHTKSDIVKIFDIPENKIKVIYNGYEKKAGKSKVDRKLIKRLNKNPYILYVGTLQPRKNIQTLIEAFAEFTKENKNYKLVIAGKKGWLYQKIFEKVKSLNITNKVIFTDYISNNTLRYLYRGAVCLVHPSYYEGFGIPLLEAMTENCPVISSNTSSLPEIGGNAALYFDPQDKNQLIKQLNNLIKHDDLRKTLIANGKERVKHFSWEKCANETLKLLKEAI